MLLYLSQMLKHSEIHLCTKVPFHGTVCHLIFKYATIHDSFKRLYKKEYFYAPT